jgi:NAD(P)-dependent dehydrogenase (short-subunit alcohol dehydrogenase family)
MTKENRSAIVTGAYGAIGKAIAVGIAENGYSVTLVGRDKAKLEKARDQIVALTSNPAVYYAVADLSLHRDILSFSKSWKGPLRLLVNNAATAPNRRTETIEGIEMQWATNVLGYFWMTRYFHPFMAGEQDARIVNVASYWAGGMDMDDPEFRQRPYDNDVAYRQAKQANRMLTVAFAGRLESAGISVNACHPGDVNSKLSNAFGFGGSESPEQGAATPLLLSISEDLRGITGKYYEHLRPVSCPFIRDRAAIERLYRLCDERVTL